MRMDPKALRLGALSFACGLHFALLQTSYFLLLEAYLSSRSLSYFVVLFFWLLGFLLGLGLRGRRLAPLLVAGLAGYYATWALARAAPFHALLYPAAAASSIASGLLPGRFFRRIGRSYAPIRRPLFHENNGFVLGLLVALKGAVHAGGWLLAAGPAVGALLVAAALGASRRDLAEGAGNERDGRAERDERDRTPTSRCAGLRRASTTDALTRRRVRGARHGLRTAGDSSRIRPVWMKSPRCCRCARNQRRYG